MAFSLPYLLGMAKAGWHLFPIREGTKTSALIKWSKGEEPASCEPDTIRKWFERWPRCNWGIATGPSGLLIVDIDVKHEAGGEQSVDALASSGCLFPDTFEVVTPTGGRHLYYMGAAPSTGPQSANKLGAGIDTRGVGGMVLAPGSVTEDGAYTATRKRRPVAMPEWVGAHLGQCVDRSQAVMSPIDLDGPHQIADVLEYLSAVEPAVEGAGGDSHTLRVAMRCKDLGVSEAVAVDLMLRAFNPRCCPPWDVDDIEAKVANAYAYGSSAPGCAAPEAAFEVIDLPPVEDRETQTQAAMASLASEIQAFAIKPRQWILGHRLIQNYCTVTIAPGGVGKTNLTILEALSVATGESLTGDIVHRPGAVWLYNTEDPLDEMERRIAAAAMHFGLDTAALDNVHITSGRERPLVLVADAGRGPVINKKAIRAMSDYIDAHSIKLLVVDPFVRTHRVNENDNMAIDLVVQAFSRIASKTGCAINIVHHTRKRGKDGASSMDDARGASALASAARVAHCLGGMSEETAATYGLSAEDAMWYVRLDDAKANLAPPSEGVRWFRKVSVQLPCGDFVGTLEPAPLRRLDQQTGDVKIIASMLKAAVELGTDTPILCSRFAKIVAEDPEALASMGGKSPQTWARRIEALLPVSDHGLTIRAVRLDGKKLVQVAYE